MPRKIKTKKTTTVATYKSTSSIKTTTVYTQNKTILKETKSIPSSDYRFSYRNKFIESLVNFLFKLVVITKYFLKGVIQYLYF
jgi:hypothetical protein